MRGNALNNGMVLQRGKFTILKVLGQGGFGITYLAELSLLQKKVAIKEFFLQELCARDTTGVVTTLTQGDKVDRYRRKFIKEAQILARLNHPGIVRVTDIFEENGTVYYVMEYVEGESLSEMVRRRGALPEPIALCYISKVAAALDYIHKCKVNHLDLKPGNIMVRRSDDEPVLIDFGVSKQYDEQKNQTTTTPPGVSHGYSPLEQYKPGGVSTFSPQSDIYSLGATLYKLLTGKTPPNANDIFNDGIPAMPSSISLQDRAAVEKAMQPRRKDRPDNVREWLVMMGLKDMPNSSSITKENDFQTVIIKEEKVDDEGTLFTDAEDLRKEQPQKEGTKRIRIEEERRRKEAVVWNTLKSCSREDVEKYGISIFSFSPGKELTIYYRGYTFVCQEEITMIRNYLDIKSLLKLITEKGGRGIFEVKDYLRKDLETYYQENSNTLANAENIITFCSESDYLRLLSNKRYYNVRRIAQEMQLLPLSFDLHKDSAYSIEYQDLFCDADIGNGLCEILQAGFIGDHRENLKDLIDSDQKLIHKKFSSFEGFTHLVLGAIVQYKILTKKYEEDSLLLAFFPFDVNAEIWVNGRCRDYLRLKNKHQEIPFIASKTIIDDDCSSIILTFLGKRFVFDVPKMFGKIPKSFEITFDVNAEFHIIFILKDKEANKVIFIRQEEFFKYEEIQI